MLSREEGGRVTPSDAKCRDFFCPEIFHEMFLKYFLKNLRCFFQLYV